MKIKSAITGLAALAAMLISGNAMAQSANPFNPDYSWCSTRGSVATRGATAWQCLTPGTSGQVLRSGGPGADVGWLTVSGTGSVTSVGLAMPPQFSVTGSPVTTAGTLSAVWASQTANTLLAAPSGSAGTPTFRAMTAADMPNAGVVGTGALSGTWPNITVGSLQVTNAMLAGSVTLAKLQTIAANTVVANLTAGTAVPTAVTVPALLDNAITGTGIVRRTGALTYTTGTTVSVAEGGTGATSASGTALDNISGMSGTGLVRRTGAGTYSQGTQVATGEIADASITTAKLATPAASGASWVLLDTQTVTGAANVAFPGLLSSTYREYRIAVSYWQPSAQSNVTMQFGTGGTYQTSGYIWSGTQTTSSGTSGVNANTSSSGILLAGTLDNTPAAALQGEIGFAMPSNSTYNMTSRIETTYRPSSGGWASWDGFGVVGSVGAVTDVRIVPGSGTVTAGVSLYGLRHN